MITRLGLIAIPRGLYGSFAGKTQEVTTPTASVELTDWIYRHDRRFPLGTNTVGVPLARFVWDAVTNPPTVFFTDQSIAATSWLWEFGDGEFSTERSPTHTFPVVGASQDFTVCLAINSGVSVSIELVTVTDPTVLTLDTLTLAQFETSLVLHQFRVITVI